MRSRQWFMAAAGCAVSFINVGFLLSMGALFHPISEKFRTNRPATALAQSLYFGTQVFGVIVGSLVDKYGLWKVSLIGNVFTVTGFGGGFFATNILHLYIVSTVSGVGITIIGLCATVAVEKATEGRTQSTAFALNSISIGLGALVYPHVLAFLVTRYGLNGTYLILAGVFCNNIILVVVSLDLPPSMPITSNYTSDMHTCTRTLNTAGKHRTDNSVYSHHLCESVLYNMKVKFLKIASIPFILTWIASVANFSASDGYLMTCVDIYTSMEFTEQQGITSMIFYQIGYISSSVLTLVLKQFKTVNTFVISSAFSISGSVGVILTYFAPLVQVAYTGAYCLGMADGVLTGTLIILGEIVPNELFGTAFGIILTSFSVASLAAGPINGALRDVTGSYAVPCLAIAIAFIFTTILFITAGFLQRKSNDRKAPQPELSRPTTKAAASFDNHSLTPEARQNFPTMSMQL